jgi:hypothetical protein
LQVLFRFFQSLGDIRHESMDQIPQNALGGGGAGMH